MKQKVNYDILVLDESGAMHLKNEDYFIIGGFITNSFDINNISKLWKKYEYKIKLENKIPKKSEFKAKHIKTENQIKMVSEFIKKSSFKPIFLIVNKKELKRKTWTEELAYQFFTKCLIRELLNKSYLCSDYYLYLDTRIGDKRCKYSFDDYLKLPSIYYYAHYYINPPKKLEWKDSKEKEYIRIADFLCNFLWINKNYPDGDKSKIISKYFDFDKFLISKFPRK